MLGLAVIDLCNKLEISTFSHYEECRNWSCWWGCGSPKVIGNIPIWYSAYDFLFDFNWNYASILYRFRVISSYSWTVTNFNLPHLHLAPPYGVILFEFCRDLWRQKTSHCAIILRYLLNRMFSHFDTILECDRQTDSQTHDDGIYRAFVR